MTGNVLTNYFFCEVQWYGLYEHIDRRTLTFAMVRTLNVTSLSNGLKKIVNIEDRGPTMAVELDEIVNIVGTLCNEDSAFIVDKTWCEL